MDILEVFENTLKSIEQNLNILESRFPIVHFWLGVGLYTLLTIYCLPIILLEREGMSVKESFKHWHREFWTNLNHEKSR